MRFLCFISIEIIMGFILFLLQRIWFSFPQKQVDIICVSLNIFPEIKKQTKDNNTPKWTVFSLNLPLSLNSQDLFMFNVCLAPPRIMQFKMSFL